MLEQFSSNCMKVSHKPYRLDGEKVFLCLFDISSPFTNAPLKETIGIYAEALYKDPSSASPISLVKKRVFWPRKDVFFYLNGDAQYSLKFPARVVPNALFLPIYVIMTSFSQKLAKFFSFVDFNFIHSHFLYGWT